jgi:hypothetical protein
VFRGLAGTLKSLLGLTSVLVVGAALALPAGAAHERPEGWEVRLTNRPMLAKQSLHEFTVRVRDETGRAVEDADVHVRLHSFRSPGYRLVRARHVGGGNYRTVARIHELRDSPRHARVVVRP